jgi:hypothetical protein
MQTFKVTLSRAYFVTIDAEDKESAKQLVEYFIGDPKDESSEKEKAEHNFQIGEIEMAMNEATEVE